MLFRSLTHHLTPASLKDTYSEPSQRLETHHHTSNHRVSGDDSHPHLVTNNFQLSFFQQTSPLLSTLPQFSYCNPTSSTTPSDLASTKTALAKLPLPVTASDCSRSPLRLDSGPQNSLLRVFDTAPSIRTIPNPHLQNYVKAKNVSTASFSSEPHEHPQPHHVSRHDRCHGGDSSLASSSISLFMTHSPAILGQLSTASSTVPSHDVKSVGFPDKYLWRPSEKCLGSGYTSTVHRSWDLETNRLVALKIVPKAKQRLLASDQYYRTLYSRLLSKSQHPNLLQLHDFFEDPTNFYVISDLCTGSDLVDFVLEFEPGTIPIKTAQDLTFQILSGLDRLHSDKIVHRDIKLDNILFESKERTTVKIIDFDMGLSLDVKTPPKVLTNPEEVSVVGTKDYMGPECYQGHYGVTSDLWSVGIILFIFLDGHFPFNFASVGKSHREAHALIKQGIKIKSSLRHRCPLAVDLMEKLLKLNPSDRIQSAVEALNHPWFSRLTVETSPPPSTLVPVGARTLQENKMEDDAVEKHCELDVQQQQPQQLAQLQQQSSSKQLQQRQQELSRQQRNQQTESVPAADLLESVSNPACAFHDNQPKKAENWSGEQRRKDFGNEAVCGDNHSNHYLDLRQWPFHHHQVALKQRPTYFLSNQHARSPFVTPAPLPNYVQPSNLPIQSDLPLIATNACIHTEAQSYYTPPRCDMKRPSTSRLGTTPLEGCVPDEIAIPYKSHRSAVHSDGLSSDPVPPHHFEKDATDGHQENVGGKISSSALGSEGVVHRFLSHQRKGKFVNAGSDTNSSGGQWKHRQDTSYGLGSTESGTTGTVSSSCFSTGTDIDWGSRSAPRICSVQTGEEEKPLEHNSSLIIHRHPHRPSIEETTSVLQPHTIHCPHPTTPGRVHQESMPHRDGGTDHVSQETAKAVSRGKRRGSDKSHKDTSSTTFRCATVEPWVVWSPQCLASPPVETPPVRKTSSIVPKQLVSPSCFTPAPLSSRQRVLIHDHTKHPCDSLTNYPSVRPPEESKDKFHIDVKKKSLLKQQMLVDRSETSLSTPQALGSYRDALLCAMGNPNKLYHPSSRDDESCTGLLQQPKSARRLHLAKTLTKRSHHKPTSHPLEFASSPNVHNFGYSVPSTRRRITCGTTSLYTSRSVHSPQRASTGETPNGHLSFSGRPKTARHSTESYNKKSTGISAKDKTQTAGSLRDTSVLTDLKQHKSIASLSDLKQHRSSLGHTLFTRHSKRFLEVLEDTSPPLTTRKVYLDYQHDRHSHHHHHHPSVSSSTAAFPSARQHSSQSLTSPKHSTMLNSTSLDVKQRTTNSRSGYTHSRLIEDCEDKKRKTREPTLRKRLL